MSARRTKKAARRPPPLEYSLLLTATLCLLAFGAVMVFSASSARSLLTGGGNGFYYLERTLVFGAIGLAVMRVASLRGVAVARTLTTLMVTHSMAQALRLGDRILIMHRGRLAYDLEDVRGLHLVEGDLLRLFDRLSDGGNVYMPLDDYDFSTRFGWVGDPYGVTWQLNLP